MLTVFMILSCVKDHYIGALVCEQAVAYLYLFEGRRRLWTAREKHQHQSDGEGQQEYWDNPQPGNTHNPKRYKE